MSKTIQVNGFVNFKILNKYDVNEVREKIAFYFGYFGDLKKYDENPCLRMAPRGKTGCVEYTITNDNKYIVINGTLTDKDQEYFQDIRDWFQCFVGDLMDMKEISVGEYSLSISPDSGSKMIILRENDYSKVFEHENVEE